MMALDDACKNEFDDILLSAVREGDVNLLESQLCTVKDPDLYLNRVYDGANKQKCTLMMVARLNGHDEIIHMLLHRFKPNLEVRNDILLEGPNKSQEILLNVSILWAAAAMNNVEMVKLLVEYGADVNHTTKTNSTPVRAACYNGNEAIVRYLVENGADINIAKVHNETNLMLSVCRKHLNIVIYLVDELKCDVNDCSTDGRSSLYDAVYSDSLELVELLLNRGARNFRAICDQMSPLMWAAVKRRVNLMEAIYPHCSLLEQIEAEELLGSSFVCCLLDDRDLEQAFEHFNRSLELRLTHNIPKVLSTTPMEIFDNRQECQTLSHLERIRSNIDNMYTEALLMRERLLGPSNAEYRYSLRCRANLLANNKEYYRAISLWLYELGLRRLNSIYLHPSRSRQLVSFFSTMVYKSLEIPVETLLTLLRLLNEELDNNKIDFGYNLHTLLFLITVISQYMEKGTISMTDRIALYRHLRKTIQHQYTTPNFNMSLLHLSLDSHTSAYDDYLDRICQYPCLQTTRILLQCGTDVNANDAVRNIPLHIFAMNPSNGDESILNILLDAGAHLDCVNALGEIPVDLASNQTTEQLLKSRMQLSLKCLCARLIQKNNIPFYGNISNSLVSFVEKH